MHQSIFTSSWDDNNNNKQQQQQQHGLARNWRQQAKGARALQSPVCSWWQLQLINAHVYVGEGRPRYHTNELARERANRLRTNTTHTHTQTHPHLVSGRFSQRLLYLARALEQQQQQQPPTAGVLNALCALTSVVCVCELAK